jgi:hypothetical protein
MITVKKISFAIFLSLLCLLPMPGSYARADEVTDAINEAMQQYKAGDFAVAASSLDYAAQLIRQKTGGRIVDMLPGPLPGWKAEEATSQAAGAAMLGGGVVAERSYSRGESGVDINITADSPMLQGMMMMLSNPMFATSNGGRLTRIAGQKAIMRYSRQEKSGRYRLWWQTVS